MKEIVMKAGFKIKEVTFNFDGCGSGCTIRCELYPNLMAIQSHRSDVVVRIPVSPALHSMIIKELENITGTVLTENDTDHINE